MREEEEDEEPIPQPIRVQKPSASKKEASSRKGVVAGTPTATTTTAAAAAIPRESRKRKVAYYEEDDLEGLEDEEDEVATPPVRQPANTGRRSRGANVPLYQSVEDLDADLILTDEENEYNPHSRPDPTKMTERQRARYNEQFDDSTDEFMSLDDLQNNKNKMKKMKSSAVEKVKETEHEAALRKAETNRRRLDYKNKQLEEEKRDTLNKLLKRRATKTREVQKGDEQNDDDDENANLLLSKPRRPELNHPALFRWVNTINGSLVGSPKI